MQVIDRLFALHFLVLDGIDEFDGEIAGDVVEIVSPASLSQQIHLHPDQELLACHLLSKFELCLVLPMQMWNGLVAMLLPVSTITEPNG
ncbi:MAG: hypothetical protein H8E47_10655 [Anaerolineales bacterium]|nr:hypothetical protein [Anaerolineales bacterium]